jgi:4-hydroxythreonine-4-phosphate dehydrogenase
LLVESSGTEALIDYGQVDPRGGAAAVSAVRTAAGAALDGMIDGICTAPLNKEAMHRAGMTYDGHTELLADIAGTPSVVMMLVGERMRVAHVTTHSALRRVPELLTRERLNFTIRTAHELLGKLALKRRRIAVAGLNPHAGESGLFGDDEEVTIVPVIEELCFAGLDVVGPISPDAVFIHALEGRYDAVVVMYHDQGHIPVKLVERDLAVNITGGLPFVRTSVDHGTAFDIAGTRQADPTNMIQALSMAGRLASGGLEGRR